MGLNDWLQQMVEQKASDLYITTGAPPNLKIHGTLVPINVPALKSSDTETILKEIMSEEDYTKFNNSKEMNYAIFRPGLGRFRVSAFQQQLQKGAVFRRIETNIPSFEDLKLPVVLKELALLKRGLVLLVGGTGTGKSSTLATMIGYRNQNTTGHIICIEDPIEFVHVHNKCLITQREVGIDTESFEVALKNSLRQAPDVILIGEIRSREIMQYALAFAETGHLCLATLHANNANQALDRIVSFFPDSQLKQLWMDLSLNLKAIVAQQLIPTKDEKGRVPAFEVLINTPVISEHIRKGEVYLLKDFMTKAIDLGMRTFDQDLFRLYDEGLISYESALKYADSENEVRLKIKLSGKNKEDDDTLGTLRVLDE
jgi:twitching motility protein PilU